MTVRAKFQLVAVTEYQFGSKKLQFQCVYDNNTPEDQRFQKATPYGNIEMNIDNPAALQAFELGKFYYFDASPVIEA